MFDISALARREIIIKFVELAVALLIVGLTSGRLDTNNAHKTTVVHATLFICIAVSFITISSSILDSPVDEGLLLVVALSETLLFVVSGGLYMEGFKRDGYLWSTANWSCSIKATDWTVMGAGIVAFFAAAVHALDFYFLFHIRQSPSRPSIAAKRRFNGVNTTAA